MESGTQESGLNVYRKLNYFYENKLPVHFCLLIGGWKNGIIVDLSEQKLTLVLKEFKEGIMPFLLEEIDVNTIEQFKERGE